MNALNHGFLLMLAVLMLITKPVMAVENDAMAKAQYMLRQIAAEKNQIAAEKQQLLAENKQLSQELEELKKKYGKLTNKSEKAESSMKGRISEMNQQYSDEVSAHNETRKQLAKVMQAKENLFNTAQEQTQSIDLCVSNNKKLYEVNQELLGKYENKGIWSVISQKEPFTGLSQVQIENLVDDYQYRLDDLRVTSDL